MIDCTLKRHQSVFYKLEFIIEFHSIYIFDVSCSKQNHSKNLDEI